MVQKAKPAKVYRTMQGKQIDMDMLRKRQELTPAVGNVRVNARGDELGPGGQIVRKREDVVAEYYENHKGVRNEHAVSKKTKLDAHGKDITDDDDDIDLAAAEIPDEDWVEDEDGNFVKKGK